jgi:hypothetical protein
MQRNPAIDLDGTIDEGIIAHEFFHYVSNRLVGNGSGLSNNQGRGMGEGWSDFNTMLLQVRQDDTQVKTNPTWNGAYSVGSYVLGDYYFGIRRAPYSTDFAKNPLTFKHIQNGVALPTTAPLAFGQDGASNAEVHNTGEIWANVLWEAYAGFLQDGRYSFKQARSKVQDYIIAGLKMTPNAPTMLGARRHPVGGRCHGRRRLHDLGHRLRQARHGSGRRRPGPLQHRQRRRDRELRGRHPDPLSRTATALKARPRRAFLARLSPRRSGRRSFPR